MSQWAEIRHQHLVEGVAKKQIARRLQLDIKTVRRAVEQPTPPVRASSPRVRSLDPWREQIAQWLDQDRRLTAKRIRRRLLPLAGPVAARTVRRYVAALKVATAPKEGYVHRSVRPGTTMEVDFGESWAEVAGVPRKVKYLVATLPYSNVYFAKAYPLERLESLLDGIESAFTYFGGVVDRVVLDNTSLAVKAVLAGRDRLETEAFAAFRGAYPFRAEFCAPAKGWEKGSVETDVKYVRNLCFYPYTFTRAEHLFPRLFEPCAPRVRENKIAVVPDLAEIVLVGSPLSVAPAVSCDDDLAIGSIHHNQRSTDLSRRADEHRERRGQQS